MNLAGFKDKILLGVSNQTIAFEAPQGRPSADGTVTLYDTRVPRTDAKNPIATGTATRKAVDAVLTSASGKSQADPNRVNCVPPAALKAGDFVLVAAAAGYSERHEVFELQASYFRTRRPLEFDYAANDTVKSAVMTSPVLTASWFSDAVNLGEDYEAVWSYTVGGVAYVATTRFDLVREAADFVIFDSDLLRRFPDLLRLAKFKAHPETVQPLIRQAQQDVEALLIGIDRDPDKCRGNEVVRFIVALRALLILADNGIKPSGVDPDRYYERRKEEWDEWSTRLIEGKLTIPYDIEEDGVVDEEDRSVMTVTLIR